MVRDFLYASITCALLYGLFSFFNYSQQTNLTDNNELWGGYDINSEYVIQTDVMLKYNQPDNYLTLIPKTCTGNCQDQQYIGVIKKGTKLHLSRLEHDESSSFFFGHVELVTPFAKIVTGEFTGKEVVIKCISIRYQKNDSGPIIYKPDSDLIAIIE